MLVDPGVDSRNVAARRQILAPIGYRVINLNPRVINCSVPAVAAQAVALNCGLGQIRNRSSIQYGETVLQILVLAMVQHHYLDLEFGAGNDYQGDLVDRAKAVENGLIIPLFRIKTYPRD